MRIDLGSVTAYSIAVKNGFTGTESEWMQAILNAGENAQDAAESALLAGQSATNAENSATSAEESAEKARIRFGSPLIAHLVADMEDENRVYVYVGEETGYVTGDWYYYDGSEWTSGGSYNAEGVNTDPTLSVEDMPADAKAVGDELENIKSAGTGLSEEAKQALLACIAHIGAWSDEHGQDYYDALEDALYPPTNLTYISCVYTQSGVVYNIDSLNSLKSDLVVTAHYDNAPSEVITTYALSGTLTSGTSVMTVSYYGETTTFNVTVTQLYVSDGLVMWLDGELNGVDGAHETTLTTWVDQSGNGWDWTNKGGVTVNAKSLVFNGENNAGFIRDSLPQDVQMMELVYKVTTGGVVIAGFGRNYLGNISIVGSTGLLVFHTGTGNARSSNTAFAIGYDNAIHSVNSGGYVDGEAYTITDAGADWQYAYPSIGHYRGATGNNVEYKYIGEIYCIRLYNRILTEDEILANYNGDVARFGLGVSE